jgi:hypothetical protein
MNLRTIYYSLKIGFQEKKRKLFLFFRNFPRFTYLLSNAIRALFQVIKIAIVNGFIAFLRYIQNHVSNLKTWGQFNMKKLNFILQDFIDFTNSSDSWLFYIPLIGLSFFICKNSIHECLISTFKFNFYEYSNLKFDVELAKNIIDTRIVNISAVFSISFVIIGFSINNLKKINEDTYDMIYRNIKLFPILYISLTVIGCLIIISLLRNTLNPITFRNSVIWGTSLIIIVLFLIGFLFNRVILHIKLKNVYEYFYNDIKRVSERIKWNYNTRKNREKLDDIKSNLNDRMNSAVSSGDNENLVYLLDVIRKVSLFNL